MASSRLTILVIKWIASLPLLNYYDNNVEWTLSIHPYNSLHESHSGYWFDFPWVNESKWFIQIIYCLKQNKFNSISAVWTINLVAGIFIKHYFLICFKSVLCISISNSDSKLQSNIKTRAAINQDKNSIFWLHLFGRSDLTFPI